MNNVHDVRTFDDEMVNAAGDQAVWVVTTDAGARLLDLLAPLDTPTKTKILTWMATLPSAWFATNEPAQV